jgi:hypothetical protein
MICDPGSIAARGRNRTAGGGVGLRLARLRRGALRDFGAGPGTPVRNGIQEIKRCRIKRSEPQMSSREPIYQLEPSNLLEPLDLAEQPAESIRRLAYPNYGTSKPAATPAMPRERVPPLIGRRRRRLKPALLVAGALGCVAAGTALPRLTTLVWGDVDASQMGLARTLAGVTRLSERAADVAVKRDEPKAAAIATASKEAAATNASDQPPAPANASNPSPAPANASSQPAAAANTSTQPPAPANASKPSAAATAKEAKGAQCNQHAASDNKCLEGAVAVPPAPASQPVTIDPPPSAPAGPQTAALPAATPEAGTPQPAESQPAGTRASVQQEERSQASRPSRRAARRDTNRTPAPRRDWAAADRAAGQRSWDNWQDRDRWQGRDANRESSWGRDPYDDYVRGDARRAVERNWRSDNRPIARSSREEVPAMPAPQFRFGW